MPVRSLAVGLLLAAVTGSAALPSGSAAPSGSTGSTSSSGSTASPGSSPAATVRPLPSAGPTAGPQPGGTLRMVAPGGIAHTDPALADTAAERQLLSVTSRQLVAYPSSSSLSARQDPAADLTTFPDISDDKLTYSFRLRDVRWPAPLSRAVRAADVVYGIKRLCWPGHLSPGLPLLERDVAGLLQFCAGLAAAAPDGAPAAVRAYDDVYDIAGVRARDAATVTIQVLRPVGDFLNTLALPYVAPIPEDAVGDDLPDSAAFREHLPALGPYAGVPSADGTLTLVRNPAWEPDSDPLRRAYPDRIEIRPVADAAAAAAAVLGGRADLVLGGLPADAVAAAVPGAAGDPRVRSTAAASLTYLLALPTDDVCGRSLGDPRVRAALTLASDRGALATAAGGTLLARPAEGLLPPGVLGAAGTRTASGPPPVPADPFATPGMGGDPAQARMLLAAALPDVGTDSPLVCTVAIQAPGLDALARALVSELAPYGVRLSIVRGRADLSLRTFVAGWRGNAARQLLTTLVARCAGVATGCYASATAGAAQSGLTGPAAAAAALTAAGSLADQNLAESAWAQAAALVLAATPVLPLVTGRSLALAGTRVTTFRWSDLAGDADLATTALSAP